MQVKIDTKEKFYAITIQESNLAANMTDDLDQCLLPILEKDVKNVVLILKDTQNVEERDAGALFRIQRVFYAARAFFVICEFKPAVEKSLEDNGLLELMNVT